MRDLRLVSKLWGFHDYSKGHAPDNWIPRPWDFEEEGVPGRIEIIEHWQTQTNVAWAKTHVQKPPHGFCHRGVFRVAFQPHRRLPIAKRPHS